jgi:hypothetical protein
MSKWYQPKLEQDISRSLLNLMNHLNANKTELFEFTQRQLQSDPKYSQILEERIKLNELRALELKQTCSELSERIAEQIHRLSNIKMINMVNYHMIKKKIDLAAFASKQDKLVRHLNMQRHRIEFLAHVQSLKLNDIDRLKEMFEQLMGENSLMPNAGALNNTNSSMMSFAAPKNNVSMMYSKQMLSSTMAPMASSHMPIFNPKPTSSNILNLSSINNHQFIENNLTDSHAPFVHLINQLLINALAKFNASLENDADDQPLFELKRPVSVNFADNLETFVDLHKQVASFCANNTSSSSQIRHVNRFYQIIKKSIEYMYERDDRKKVSSSSLGNLASASSSSCLSYKLNKLNIRMVKSLQQPLEKLSERTTELESAYVSRVFKKLHECKAKLGENELCMLKRDLFVYFYSNPMQMESIIERLNSL